MTIINGIEIDDINYTENEIKKAIINNDPIEDKLHVIIVISNPSNSAVRYILTREFIKRMKDDVNIILSHLDKHFATIGKKLDAIENALRPRYESIDIIRNNQGLQTQFKLNPIKGN